MNWTRSTYCASAACLEAARDGTDILLRDSNQPAVTLRFDRDQWREFLGLAARWNRLTTHGVAGCLLYRTTDGLVAIQDARRREVQVSHLDWAAFAQGAAGGDFAVARLREVATA